MQIDRRGDRGSLRRNAAGHDGQPPIAVGRQRRPRIVGCDHRFGHVCCMEIAVHRRAIGRAIAWPCHLCPDGGSHLVRHSQIDIGKAKYRDLIETGPLRLLHDRQHPAHRMADAGYPPRAPLDMRAPFPDLHPFQNRRQRQMMRLCADMGCQHIFPARLAALAHTQRVQRQHRLALCQAMIDETIARPAINLRIPIPAAIGAAMQADEQVDRAIGQSVGYRQCCRDLDRFAEIDRSFDVQGQCELRHGSLYPFKG